MAMNTSKVITGGVLAGVILTAIDMISNFFLIGDRMVAEANAFKAGVGDMMASPSPGGMAAWVIMNMVVGMLLVFTYAGFRPRFGPGAKTAMYVALVFLAFGLVVSSSYMAIGMMSRSLWTTYAAIWLVNLILAALAGARIYSEESETP